MAGGAGSDTFSRSLPARLDAVLFDAGGVLLDLDYAYLRRLIEPRHGAVSLLDLSRAEAHARVEVERMVREGGRVGRAWRDYFHFILGTVGVPADGHEAIIDSLWDAHQHVGLWTVAVEGALEAVGKLKQRGGLRLGVVSNAEGKVARDLDRAGFAGLFDTVVDSFVVGVEKPDPAIFRLALERLGVRAEHALFIGDLPAVDVAGARAAGITALLLDRHDLFPAIDAPRLRAIGDLASLLEPEMGQAATRDP